MKPCIRYLAAVLLGTFLLPAQARWGDDSYDPAPAIADLDRDAQFDSFGLLSLLVSSTNGAVTAQQNFESGFAGGQALGDWIALGTTRMRIGFGASLDHINWQSRIGQVDPASSSYGLSHPHGTYGNAPGLTGDPRNYIADHYFLTADTAAGSATPAYLVVQFEQPVSSFALSMIDYANGTGGSSEFSLWNGSVAGEAVQLDGSAIHTAVWSVTGEQPDGSIDYFFGGGPFSSELPHLRQTFGLAVLRMDRPDASVGFDNFIAGVAPVPEPASYALMAAGLLMVGMGARRGRPQSL